MHHPTRPALLVVLAIVVGCEGPLPPPPALTVTSPQRSLVQAAASRIEVRGTALPGPTGDPVVAVKVNNVPAMLAADGSFTANIDVPAGAMLIETVATSAAGSKATDARAVQVGELRAVGTPIERAVTAALSAETFVRLSATAGPFLESTDLSALLAPLQPIASLGDDLANLKLTITKLTIGDAKIAMTPVDGGLQFSADLDGLGVAANAAYGGALVIDGTTAVTVTADRVTIGGTLVVTPAGTAGFATKLSSPTVQTTNLHLDASGLAGQILTLLDNNLASTVNTVVTSGAEAALQPLLNDALGALTGPRQLDVLGQKLDLQATPSAITFSRDGALVTINLQAMLEGSQSSPGFVFTANGTPTMDMHGGIQLGLADDLVNEMLAEVHALGLLDLHIQQDFGVFDDAHLELTMPPMISANTRDGTMRLVLGDMLATFSDHGKPVINAAINAQVDLAIARGTNPQEIALQFGKVALVLNVLDNAATSPDEGDLASAASSAIAVQLDTLKQFMITLPVPSVAGVTLDNLSLHTDSGYVLVSGEVH